MINEIDGTITLTNENNEQIKVQALFSFEMPEFKKKYIVYTLNPDATLDEVNVLISEINYDTLEIKSIPEDEKSAVIEFYNSAKQMLLSEDGE